MAAYAAAQSLTTLLEQVQLYQDRDPVLVGKQVKQLAFIQEKVSSFQCYLESYHGLRSEEAQDLEVRISDACYKAEDEIESYIVDYIHLKKEYKEKVYFRQWRKKKRANKFSHGLQKVINEMDSIEKKVTESKEQGTLEDRQALFFTPVGSIRPPPTHSDMFVGRDGLLISVIDKIVRGQPNRQVIPITGMGGIGKTMFARNVYDGPHAKQHFDICGWVTISQVYDIGKLMLCLLRHIKALSEGEGENLAVDELGQRLHKHLWGRRYLVVLDDMWSIDAWSVIQRFLPDNSNGSRVMVTSRLVHVTNCIDPSNHIEMNLLDENESWELLEKKAFGKEKCPPELKDVGKRIAINCKGLPLAVVVIGGLLAKSEMILQDWEKISANISETVNSAEDGSCLAILSLSYNHLPVYLKPCFLYMGMFAEDEEIRVSRLINLWVSEGFLKPIHGKCMEEVAEIYLIDLIERNLIFVSGRKFDGVVKDCKTHDLLRDLCLREAKRFRFFSFITDQSPVMQDISSHRRIGVYCMRNGDLPPEVCRALQSASFLRSVVDTSQATMDMIFNYDVDSDHLLQLKPFKLMRVLDVTKNYPCEVIFRLVNSRHISYLPEVSEKYIFSSLNLFWNIQTLVMGFALSTTEYIVPSIIWEMPQLRQIKIHDFVMPEPPSRKPGGEIVVQKHLQILLMVWDFKLTEEILNGRPNMKKLKITQGWDDTGMRFSDYSLNNLVLLDKLQSFYCWFGKQYSRTEVLKGIKFPLSLKKLTLVKCPFEWDDMAATVGDLPQLEVLDLNGGCCGEEWNPLDGQFLRLKRLSIGWKGPSQWNADSTHFPVLEELQLSMIGQNMREIPRGIGEIETLRSVHVYDCCDSLVTSAKEILEEQEMLGNDDFKLIVKQHGTGESNEHDTDEEHDWGEEHEGHEEDDGGNCQGAGAA